METQAGFVGQILYHAETSADLSSQINQYLETPSSQPCLSTFSVT